MHAQRLYIYTPALSLSHPEYAFLLVKFCVRVWSGSKWPKPSQMGKKGDTRCKCSFYISDYYIIYMIWLLFAIFSSYDLVFSLFLRFLGQIWVFPWEWCEGCGKVYSRQDNSDQEVPRGTTAASPRGEAGLRPGSCFPHHRFFFFRFLRGSWGSPCSHCCLCWGHWGPQGGRGPARGGAANSTTDCNQQHTRPHR